MLKNQLFSSTIRATGPWALLAALDHPLFEARFLCDSRWARGIHYLLGDFLAVIVVGVFCGNDDAEAVAQGAGHERDWLMEHVPGLDVRTPSQGVILRMFALIRVDVFSELLRGWTQKFFGRNALEAGHIACDGKTKRSARTLRHQKFASTPCCLTTRRINVKTADVAACAPWLSKRGTINLGLPRERTPARWPMRRPHRTAASSGDVSEISAFATILADSSSPVFPGSASIVSRFRTIKSFQWGK